MRRSLKPPALFAAGLALFLAACSGDSPPDPTGPEPPGGGGNGAACNVTVTLQATSLTPLQGTFVTLRATVTRNGVKVPDGTSVSFITDFGFFNENGLQSIVKTVVDGVADVSPAALRAGTAHIKAIFECGEGHINIEFQAIPDPTGPFISTIQPTTGTCAGGDVITIEGGNFGNDAATTRVLFGGAPGSIQSVNNTEIRVKTPARTLANPSVPEQVDVVVTVGVGTAGARSVTKSKAFTYTCVGNRVFISTVNPTAGSPAGDETVTVNGGFFGTSIATTRVTFCGTSAQITAQTDNAITVKTPRHTLVNPVGDVCDVSVTIDLGLVSQQSAVLPAAFTFRGSGGGGGGGSCNSDPGFFVSSVAPNTGPPDGGTVVTITGGGFSAVASNFRVDFGSTQAAITSSTATTITVSSPRHTLATAGVPETVDVTVTDLASPSQRCAKLLNAFRYTSVALDPVIYDVSPRIGPNDARTRVTIFGNNFQFPAHVFVGDAEATVVGSVLLDQIVILVPTATGPNIGLANRTVDIKVLNSTSGKSATCPGCFRYYGCPQVFGASPSTASYTQTTPVTINGANFEEPLEATFTAPGAGSFRLNVTSVSASAVVVTMPPLATILQGNPAAISCLNVAGTISLTFQSLACNPVSTTFTYRVDPPSMTSASPNSLNQDGSPFGTALGSPQATITVIGANFTDPVTVSLTKGGSVVNGTTVNNVVVSNPNTLTFTAPAVTSAAMNTGNCVIGAGVTGTRFLPTAFGIRVTNTRTACTADLPGVLVYNPTDPACTAALAITTSSLPTGIICAPYATSLSAGGGTPPYTFSITGTLPPGISMNPAGAFSGTPVLGVGGAGGAQTFSFSASVTDSASGTSTAGLSIVVNDPNGPFSITGSAFQSVPAAGGNGTVLTANPNPTSPGFTPVSWSILSVTPSAAPGSITLNSATGQTNFLVVTPGVPAGNYDVAIEILDTICSGPQHSASQTVTMTKNP